MHDGSASHNSFTPISKATPEIPQMRTPKNFFVWGEGSFIFLPPIDLAQPRGPKEEGASGSDESPEDGRLPALRCGDWIGSSLSCTAVFRRAKGSRTTSENAAAPKNAAFPLPPDHARLIPTITPAANPTARPQNNAPRIRRILFFAVITAQSPRQGIAATTSNSMASIYYADRLRSDTAGRSPAVVCADWIALLDVGKRGKLFGRWECSRCLSTIDAPQIKTGEMPASRE